MNSENYDIDLKIKWVGGIAVLLSKCKLLFDPIRLPPFKPDFVFVSHAHRDHVNPRILGYFRDVGVYMSEPTARLLFKRSIPDYVRFVEDALNFKGVEFKFYDSGHIVGSKSVLINSDVRIFYTGDLSTDTRIVLNPLKPVETDILIIEATYGAVPYIFPERHRLYRKILRKVSYFKDVGRLLVLGARSPGTAQELAALLSNSRKSFDIYMDPKVYRDSLVHFDYDYVSARFERAAGFALLKGDVFITSINNALKLKKEGFDSLVFTGWSVLWDKKDSFPLSSHDDLHRLVDFVGKSNPETVYTVYGFKRDFALILKNIGVNARHL